MLHPQALMETIHLTPRQPTGLGKAVLSAGRGGWGNIATPALSKQSLIAFCCSLGVLVDEGFPR